MDGSVRIRPNPAAGFGIRALLDFAVSFCYNQCVTAGSAKALGSLLSTTSTVCAKDTGRSVLTIASALQAALASPLGTKQWRRK